MKLFIPRIWALALFGLAMLTVAASQCFMEEDDPNKTETSVDALSSGSTNFAYDLFKKVVQSPSDPTPSGNVFISPISVWSALGICYLGTKAQTKKELGIGLGIDKFKQETVADLYPQFQDGLLHNATKTANYTFNLANKLYFDGNIQLKECVAQRLDAELEKVDFRSAPEASRELINKYVEGQTNNKIVDLIPQGHVDANTIMVIVNAAYFKGAWEKPFMGFDTHDGDFFVEPNKPKTTKLMFQRGRFSTGEDTALSCSVIELPYSGNEMSMLILLPDSHNAEDLIQKLTKENVDTIVAKLASKMVELSMPKFKIEQKMELKDNMRAMGVNDLFDSTRADLSGFTGSNNSFVSFLRHKTYVEVTESGTEAAAATAVGVSFVSLPLPAPEFKINRPFVFLLRNKKLNVITFIGLIKDPTATV